MSSKMPQPAPEGPKPPASPAAPRANFTVTQEHLDPGKYRVKASRSRTIAAGGDTVSLQIDFDQDDEMFVDNIQYMFAELSRQLNGEGEAAHE